MEILPNLPELISDNEALGPERSYVSLIAAFEPMVIRSYQSLRFLLHSIPTNTCAEKTELLCRAFPKENWTLERTVKALYGAIDQEIYGFVLPELGTRKKSRNIDAPVVRKVFSELNMDPPFDSQFYLHKDFIPQGMEEGTCTPFVTSQEIKKINKIFVLEQSYLNEELVDVSLGGKGEYAHKISLNLPYGAIYKILAVEYGREKIKEVNFF